MKLFELLLSQAAALPGTWTGNDFVIYLNRFLRNYLDEVDQLDSGCVLGQRVKAALPRMEQLRGWLGGAVARYLENRPDDTYAEVVKAVSSVLSQVTNMYSLAYQPLGPLFRTQKFNPGDTITRARLFHTSFNDRQYVGTHRYGIPGFPCLYLGGSLKLCQEECRIPDDKLPLTGIARFEARREIKVLDFGYRPGSIGTIAKGRLLTPAPNPKLDDFIVNYAMCWPLIAACSIRTQYSEKFNVEYIIPQTIVQWLLRESVVDGVRYFSTRLLPYDPTDASTHYMNYVFPASHHQGVKNGYSQKLINLFAMTDAKPWAATTSGTNLAQEFQDNANSLIGLPVAPFTP